MSGPWQGSSEPLVLGQSLWAWRVGEPETRLLGPTTLLGSQYFLRAHVTALILSLEADNLTFERIISWADLILPPSFAVFSPYRKLEPVPLPISFLWELRSVSGAQATGARAWSQQHSAM